VRILFEAKKISKAVVTNKKKAYIKTEGISSSEVESRRVAGECLRCAWPSDRTGSRRVKDCVRQIKLDKGTAIYPKAKRFEKIIISDPDISSEQEDN